MTDANRALLIVTDTNRTLVLWLIQTEHWCCDWAERSSGIADWCKQNTGIVTDSSREHWHCDWCKTKNKQTNKNHWHCAWLVQIQSTSIVTGTNRTLALWWYKQNISIVTGKNTSIVTGANRTLALWLVQTEHWHCDWCKRTTGMCAWLHGATGTLALWLMQTQNTHVRNETLWLVQAECSYHDCCWQNASIVSNADRTLVLWLSCSLFVNGERR